MDQRRVRHYGQVTTVKYRGPGHQDELDRVIGSSGSDQEVDWDRARGSHGSKTVNQDHLHRRSQGKSNNRGSLSTGSKPADHQRATGKLPAKNL